MPSPRRRWFRFAFSLRTLFVVMTLASVWFGWQVKIVKERKAALRKANIRITRETVPEGVAFVAYQDEELPLWTSWRRRIRTKKPIPIWRRWLGDRPVEEIMYFTDPRLLDETEQRIKALFPEAAVVECFDVERLGSGWRVNPEDMVENRDSCDLPRMNPRAP